MSTRKNVGIWMDHSHAQITEFTTGKMHTMVVLANHSQKEKTGPEHQAHNREQHTNASYYGNLSTLIRKYDEVLLFGPTTAKSELANLLKEDHLFNDINIVVKQSDNLNERDQHELIRSYFNKENGTNGSGL